MKKLLFGLIGIGLLFIIGSIVVVRQLKRKNQNDFDQNAYDDIKRPSDFRKWYDKLNFN